MWEWFFGLLKRSGAPLSNRGAFHSFQVRILDRLRSKLDRTEENIVQLLLFKLTFLPRPISWAQYLRALLMYDFWYVLHYSAKQSELFFEWSKRLKETKHTNKVAAVFNEGPRVSKKLYTMFRFCKILVCISLPHCFYQASQPLIGHIRDLG